MRLTTQNEPGLCQDYTRTRLLLSAVELAALRRACEILEAAEQRAIDSLIRPEEWQDPKMVSLGDLDENLARLLHSGAIRQLIEEHGERGIDVSN